MRSSRLSDFAPSAERGLRVLLVGIALGFVGLFYMIALRRYRFPLQLEWAEGGVLDMVRRVVAHQQIYVAPSKDFIPFMYTPLYYYLSAGLSRLTGLSFVPLRLVSIVATTGCLVLIYRYVRRITGDRFVGFVACGLFAALYGLTNTWFDLARVDMLYLFFLLLAIDASQRGAAVWSAIAFAVAFQTKQSAAGVAVLVLAHEIRRPRKLIEGLGTFGLLAGISYLWLDHENGGWYRYYTTFLPSHQAWVSHKFLSFWLNDLIDPLGIALVVIVLGAMLVVLAGPGDLRQRYFVGFTTVGITVSSLSARLHLGGTTNVTLPMLAWICMLFGICLHAVLQGTERAPRELASTLRVAVIVGCMVQFAQLYYSPGPLVPTAAQKASAATLLGRVSAVDGKIFVIHDVIDSGMAGKQGFANSMAMWDVLRADHGPAGVKLREELVRAFQQREYTGILSDRAPGEMDPWEEGFLTEVTAAAGAAYPERQEMLSPLESVLFWENPVTPGVQPRYLYLPRVGSGVGVEAH
jgi:4-amino-4-deoxy-L-arabinose transferase-like glycosyltransferase